MISHLTWAIGGAVSFWVPVILVFALERAKTNLVVANLMAMFGFLVCLAVRRWLHPKGRQGLWILMGCIFLGPSYSAQPQHLQIGVSLR